MHERFEGAAREGTTMIDGRELREALGAQSPHVLGRLTDLLGAYHGAPRERSTVMVRRALALARG